jgi:hypothetical protein
VQAQFLAHSVLESIKALSNRKPEQIKFFPARFEVAPTQTVSYSFNRYRVRNLLEVFDHVHGANKAITPDSKLFDQFNRYQVIVELSSASRPGAYQVKVSASWKFEGKKKSLELFGNIQAVNNKFETWER